MKKIKRLKNIKNKSFFKRENKKFYFFAGGMLVCISLKDEIPFGSLWFLGGDFCRIFILQGRSMYIKNSPLDLNP
ncbi:hypothetical protein BSK20_00580 [SR1 bacterium human oral taxon HOT-345]|nr:hypothetical protein BSK20_00580 [SR1 bacterium human oral taxon HOT-345]